jgi:hydrogenase small subunit
MSKITRRKFLAQSIQLAALMGLEASAVPQIAQALEQLSKGTAPILWLQGLSCSGCSVSLLNSEAPSPAQLLTRYISLWFHSTLSTATGHMGMSIVNQSIEKGGYFLAVEGSMPVSMPEACRMGGEPVTHLVAKAAAKAQAIVAVGTCASFGGIPAAENNPTGAMSVPAFLKSQNISKPIIVVPGCPIHPDWLVGTLIHVIKFGIPALDEQGRPKMFYGDTIHNQCPRFSFYESEMFAKTFSDQGCLFQLGCFGPRTFADCTTRLWNSRMNSCINAGAPCVGCASEDFARKATFHFYRKNEKN